MPASLADDTRTEQSRPFIMPLKPGFSFLVERSWPAIVGISAGVSVLWIPSLWLLKAEWEVKLLVDKTLDVEIGLLAGLVAVVAFLPAIEEKTVIRKFRQWGWYKYLVGYLREAIWVSGLAMLLSLALIVILRKEWEAYPRLDHMFSAAWWGFLVYSLAAALRIVRLALRSLLAE